MKKVKLTFFYLLLVLLPTQLGRHFFFSFSFISGIRNDYLTPTLYLTDILIFVPVFITVLEKYHLYMIFGRKQKTISVNNSNYRIQIFLLLIFLYLLVSSFFIAREFWPAIYKTFKICEFVLLGISIVEIVPKLKSVVLALSVGAFYSSVIAIMQFVMQKSIGGWLWFLGERTFYASTPGIATENLWGSELLRPYATFSHPNVLGGFLSVVILLLLYQIIFKSNEINFLLRLFYRLVLLLSVVALYLTFSKAAYFSGVLGIILLILNFRGSVNMFLSKHRNILLISLYGCISFSILLFFILDFKTKSFSERNSLINAAIHMISDAPLTGVGLNNYVIRSKHYLPKVEDLYIFQPVHNLFLLVTAELGIIGFLISIIFTAIVFFRTIKLPPIYIILMVQLLSLALIDHYLITLQQGQLFLTITVSLIFSCKDLVLSTKRN